MIKFVHVSDTHLREFKAPPGDILVHSGDALNSGQEFELEAFIRQLEPIKDNYKHIVFVPGNHDRIFEKDWDYACYLLKDKIPNIHILHNNELELMGVKIYGTADQPLFGNWAFNRTPHELLHSYSNIPDDIDVLITHCPPKNIRDFVINNYHYNGICVGSEELTFHLPRFKKLKAHMFGHIHYSHGISLIDGVLYSNGAVVDERYIIANEANEFEIQND